MADTDLLKYAAARDDYTLRQRIIAALMVEALNRVDTQPVQTAEALAMTNWVLDNPMQPIDLMTAFVVTTPAVAASVTIDNGAVDTAQVLDTDIENIVSAKWNTVAGKRFPAATA